MAAQHYGKLSRLEKRLIQMARYDKLLDHNQQNGLTDSKKLEVMELRKETDRGKLNGGGS